MAKKTGMLESYGVFDANMLFYHGNLHQLFCGGA
jgi:hypothetical protein